MIKACVWLLLALGTALLAQAPQQQQWFYRSDIPAGPCAPPTPLYWVISITNGGEYGCVWNGSSYTWGMVVPSGGIVAAQPYMQIGPIFYLPQDGMSVVTKPLPSPAWINNVKPGVMPGDNGDVQYTTTGTGTFYWETEAGTHGVEAAFQCTSGLLVQNVSPVCGIWVSTSTMIYLIASNTISGSTTTNASFLEIESFSYNGTGNPTSETRIATLIGGFNGYASQYVHLKIVKAGSNLQFLISQNGGKNTFTLYTVLGVGPITAGGMVLSDGGAPMQMEVASEAVN